MALVTLLLGCRPGMAVSQGFETGDGESGSFGDETGDGEDGIPPGEVPPPLDPGCGDGVVEPGEFCHRGTATVDAGIDPCALAVDDLDRDGHMDLAVPNSDFTIGSGHVANVLLGDGAGGLGTTAAYLAGAPMPVAIALGDVDGDGWTDLVTGNYTGQEVNVLRNQGGTFDAGMGAELESSATAVAAGDLDGDGLAEVVTTSGFGVATFRATGGGALGLFEDIGLGGAPDHLTLADFDGDGNLDLAVTGHGPSGDGQLEILPGTGTGSFADMVTVDAGFSQAWIHTSDIDGDGILDVLIADGSWGFSEVRGLGDWAFEDATWHALEGRPNSIAAGDFDADGRTDVVLTLPDEDEVVALLGTENGYEERARWATGSLPVSVVTADFNEDGIDDFAYAAQLGNKVTIIASNP